LIIRLPDPIAPCANVKMIRYNLAFSVLSVVKIYDRRGFSNARNNHGITV